jgi:hypothetical protein
MSSIIEFPITDRPITESEIDKLHSEAFRDLEGRIADCAIMASIALQMVEPAIGGREDKHEKAMFAVFEVAKMLKKLKADYQAMWYGEKRCDQ